MPLQLPSVFNVIMQAKGKCFSFSFFFKSSGPHPCSERKRQDSPRVLLELEGWLQAANRRGTAWPETVALAVLMPSQKRKKDKRHDLKRGHDNCKSPQTTVEKKPQSKSICINNKTTTCKLASSRPVYPPNAQV